MKNVIKSLILAVFLGSTVFISPVLAYSPSLSAVMQGSGSVLITVTNANPYNQVSLYSRQSSSLWSVVNNIGQTDGSGYFSQIVSVSTDGSSSPIQLYVTTGGLQSSVVSVYPYAGGCYGGACGTCTYNCGNPAPNSQIVTITVSVGQTANAPMSYNYSGSLYVSSNSNPSIASATILGGGVNSVSFYGLTAGSDNIIICSNSNSSCTTYLVTVSGNTCYSGYCGGGSLTFSQSSLNVNIGQNSSVTAYNNNGTLYISNNSNSYVASGSVSGNLVSVYGLTGGTTNITICSNVSSCGVLYVTVGSTGSGTVTLSPSTLNLSSPQTSTVNIFSNNYTGGFYISSNSSPTVASASVSGNLLYVNSLVGGSTTIIVCQNSYTSQCASLYVTVNNSGCYGSNCGNTLSLSQTNANLNIGQSTTITAYNNNGGSLYISNNSNSSVASASISGSSVNILGFALGTSNVTICSNGSGQCAIVYVNVVGGNNTGITFSQSSVSMTVSQTTTVGVSGTGGYYISNNSSSGVVTATISGNTIYLNSLSSGSSTITVCQSLGSSQCGYLYVTVTGSNGSGAIWFSQNSVNLSTSQSSAITVYSNNYGGSYYISSNPNSGVVSANIVGSVLNLAGISTGSSNIIVCQSNGNSACGTIFVTVAGCTYSGCGTTGTITLSQSTLNLSSNQSAAVNIYGGGSYYISSNSNNSAASVTLSGSVINVYAGQSGNTTVSICQSTYNACVSLYITVNGGSSGSGNGGSVLGASIYPNGTLISEGQAVYIVYKNTKTGFSSEYVFTGLGYNFGNVIAVGNSGLYNSGYIVSTPFASHPWGAWVKYGQAVYMVNEQGLIPVPDWNTFLSNGGNANMIVSANSYDLRLPILSPMVYSDARLR